MATTCCGANLACRRRLRGTATPSPTCSLQRATRGGALSDSDEIQWSFADEADARAYLWQLTKLWGMWLGGLAVLFLTSGWMLIVFGLLLLVALPVLGSPLMARAERVVPEHEGADSGTGAQAVGAVTRRDKALRQLIYGTAPLRAALATIGASGAWVALLYLGIGVTVVAFVSVVFDVLRG